MTTIKQEYGQYLTDNFKGQKKNLPFFVDKKISLRFDLQVGETDKDEYFKEVVRRSSVLFEATFDPKDEVFLFYSDYKRRRRKIRFTNYCFKQINNLKKQEVTYSKVRNLYTTVYDKDGIYNIAVLKLKSDRVNYKNILTAIANTDFPPREPRFTFWGFSNIEIFFINTTKNLIFHMYDDRGLDIIASDVESLRPIYTRFNDWILAFNREEIDKMMSGKKQI